MAQHARRAAHSIVCTRAANRAVCLLPIYILGFSALPFSRLTGAPRRALKLTRLSAALHPHHVPTLSFLNLETASSLWNPATL